MNMLSQTAEHALRALLYLARQPEDAAVPADAIARAIDAPRNYLSKTLNTLARQGIVSGTRGPNGGFRLVLRPGEITLARVMEAFADTGVSRKMCLLGGETCSDQTACAAHFRWKEVWREAALPLERTTLADLLAPELEISSPQVA